MIDLASRVFVDTNVLVYAHDLDAGPRHETALALVRDLWRSRTGVLSTQVLQELYVTITRKVATPLTPRAAREIVDGYATWEVVAIGADDVSFASQLEERHSLSFWDALIVNAARKAGTPRLISEDFNAGQVIEGVQIENPFHPASAPTAKARKGRRGK